MTKKRTFHLIAAICFAFYAVWSFIGVPLRYYITYKAYGEVGVSVVRGMLDFQDYFVLFMLLAIAVLFVLRMTKLADKIPDWAFLIPLGGLVLSGIYGFISAFETYRMYAEIFKDVEGVMIIMSNLTMNVLGLSVTVLSVFLVIFKKKLHVIFFLPAVLGMMRVAVYCIYLVWSFAMADKVMWQNCVMASLDLFGHLVATVAYLFFGFALVKFNRPEVTE